ncbi:hypothetical protein M2451_002624 [Dysgonomonas sp. PFB1-18]|uniref:hypothetical protein n=1 Tax=unclassified Dysgonomonas TaxID=2630389 RepID=UPI002473B594|nr:MULTISPECIES: hypothetical protein [unclassified Dysgonomonas]MDH6308105.1 hypothetical protein [Dysgonomonas sp. PF1-14]MDH6339644.1 hypothetical protein [Dysgonomonas sp. PF1-16]MDH6381295.1 hypothetical protein [Dysgonomonas sp. PFB1-18]MDH6398507.1 hypothetical protein [Dysgonomonas sp. PF1-23]
MKWFSRVKISAFFLLATLAFIGCSKSPQQKAEELVKNYLKENLHDPQSYESVVFSKIDTIWDYQENKIEALEYGGKTLIEKYQDTLLISNALMALEANDMETYKSLTSNIGIQEKERISTLNQEDKSEYYKTADSIRQILKHFEMEKENIKKAPPIMDGFSIEHKYRAKNAMGAKVLNEATFMIDSELTSITNVKD